MKENSNLPAKIELNKPVENNPYSLALTIQRSELEEVDGILQRSGTHIVPIRELEKWEIKTLVMECIELAIFIAGWKKLDDKDLETTINILVPEFLLYNKYLTNQEIKNAFENGAKGKYGESYGMSARTAINWVTCYQEDPSRIDALKMRNEAKPKFLLENKPKELTRPDRIAWANEAFGKFRFNGKYEDYGNFVYDFLDAEGLMTFNTEQKNKMLDVAKQQLIKNLSEAKTREEKRKNDNKISDILEGDDNKTPIILAKKIALNTYFEILDKQKFTEIPFKNDANETRTAIEAS